MPTMPTASGPGAPPTRVAFTTSGTAIFYYLRGNPTVSCTFMTTPTRAGTVILHREDADGDWHQIGSAGAVAVLADAEDTQEVAYPTTGIIRVTFTEGGAGAGECLFEVSEG